MVPPDLAAGNAAGGQLPIRTTEREHEVRVSVSVCVSVCFHILLESESVLLALSVISVLRLLELVHIDTNYILHTGTHTHTVHLFWWMRDINKSTA